MLEPVRWRHDGHQLPAPDATTSTRMLLLRFDSRVFDADQIITISAGTAVGYADICRAQGLPEGEFVLPLSCFAITKHWTPQRLAEGTRYEQYRAADPSVLHSGGFELWPTAVFGEDGEPDPRNEVHLDLVLDRIHLVDLQEIILRRPGRRAVRAKFKPRLELLVSLLGEPLSLHDGEDQ